MYQLQPIKNKIENIILNKSQIKLNNSLYLEHQVRIYRGAIDAQAPLIVRPTDKIYLFIKIIS